LSWKNSIAIWEGRGEKNSQVASEVYSASFALLPAYHNLSLPSASPILHPALAWGMHLASGTLHPTYHILHTEPQGESLKEGGSNRCSSYCLFFGGKSVFLFPTALTHACVAMVTGKSLGY